MVLTEKVNALEAVLIPDAAFGGLFCRPPLRGSFGEGQILLPFLSTLESSRAAAGGIHSLRDHVAVQPQKREPCLVV